MSNTAANSPDLAHIFPGKSKMAAWMRTFDWSMTELGSPSDWPQSLKISLRIALLSQQPMLIWWGEQLIQLYNDDYAAFLADQPAIGLGQPALISWPNQWEQIALRAKLALSTNEFPYDEVLPFLRETNSYPEKTNMSFSCCPLLSDEGTLGGILFIVNHKEPQVAGAEDPSAAPTAAHSHSLAEGSRVKAALRQSEEQLRIALDIAELGTWTWHLATGVGSLDTRGAEIVGLRPGALDSVMEAQMASIHPDDLERITTELGAGIKGSTIFNLAYRVIYPDGSIHHVASRASVSLDAAGQPIQLMGTNRDVTAEREAEAALRQSEERLKKAIQIATVGVVFFDDAGVFLDANDAFLKMIGYTRRDFAQLAMSADHVTPPEWMPRTQHALAELKTAGMTTPYEKELLRPDGSRWWGLFAGTKLSANENVEFVLDVTTRKHVEQTLQQLNTGLEAQIHARTTQLRAMASRLTLAEQEERRRISQILHDDLQQLLYSIKMRVMLMITDIAADKHTRLTEYSQEIYTWLDDAIDTTRHLTVDLSPPILKNEGLTDALKWLVSQMAEMYNLKILIRAEHSFYLSDQAMRVLLFQIVRELLFNIVKHAGTDHATIDLAEADDGTLQITVSDQGRGFTVSVAELKKTDGFGLASVRERMTLFGGSMSIQSTPGQGSRIILTVPQQKPL